jgi:DUF4097 and DUF4098 domain-containing protein YvlB
MIRYRLTLVACSIWAVAVPASAAVTKSAALDEHPRAGWFDRYQESRQGPEQSERITETYKVGPEAALDLTHISGDVHITTGRANEIKIEAIKRVRHRDPDAGKRLLEQLRVDVTQVGGRLEVRTIYPRTSGRSVSWSIDYTLTVPAATAVAVKTISGDVSVTGVRGEVRAETTSGNVDVVSVPNLAVAKTVSGNVHARDIAGPSNLTLATLSGTVVATGLKVRTLDAGAVSGNIQLSDLQVERLSAKTISGDVEFEGTLARGGRYEFNAHSGNVRLTLSSPSGFELDASTFSGTIRSDFPVTLRATPRTDPDPRGRRGNGTRAIRGTFGDGSAIVAVRSFSGTVAIVKK